MERTNCELNGQASHSVVHCDEETLSRREDDPGAATAKHGVESGIEKLLKGVLRYKNTIKKDMAHEFEEIRDHPHPTSLVYTCIDSRVLPSRFCQANVGDMFIVRNAGNLIPHCKHVTHDTITTEPAALELACVVNDIKHVIVIAHSDCKAMNLLYSLRNDLHLTEGTPLEMWVKKYGAESVIKFEGLQALGFNNPITIGYDNQMPPIEALIDPEDRFQITDKLALVNCLQQMRNIASHSFIRDRLRTGQLQIHGMFFDIYSGEVYKFSRQRKKFIPVDEETVFNVFLQENEKTTQV